MKKVGALISFLLLPISILLAQVDTSYLERTLPGGMKFDIRLARNASQYYYLQEGQTFSFRRQNGQPTNTYTSMTSWETSQYTEGHLRYRNYDTSTFELNYRLLFPLNYNEQYEKGYPMIVMIHGFGERGNCWNNNCYWSNTSYNPNTNDPTAPTASDHPLLNNDHNLLHGGKPHLDAVNRAAGKLPDDPTLHPRAFPGFVLFPQNLNGWNASAVQDPVNNAIRLVRLLIKRYNIDPNRIYIHGLSNGGQGVYDIIKRAPWLFAAALPMSAFSDTGITGSQSSLLPEISNIPLWIFQGGTDTGPKPTLTAAYVKAFQNAGFNVRYTLYPNLGHGVWNSAYNEPDFFSWMLAKTKANPHIMYGRDKICATSGEGVEMRLAHGFFAYQWERDGEIIPGATSHTYVANFPGTYRTRFSRVPNPGPNDWNRWSDPIVIGEVAPPKPSIIANYTTIFPTLNGSGDNLVQLRSTVAAERYLWFRDGTAINFGYAYNESGVQVNFNDTVSYANVGGAFGIPNRVPPVNGNSSGDFTLKIADFSGCASPLSDVISVRFGAPENLTAPTGFTGSATSSTSILLVWNDNVTNETGYEIWRRKGTSGNFVFVTKTIEDAVSYHDMGLEPNTAYHYKIRAVNNTSRSPYAPDNNVNTNLVITTSGENTPPSPPQNLTVVSNTGSTITLSWTASAATDVQQYVVYYNGDSVLTGSTSTQYTLSNLPINNQFTITVRTLDFGGLLSAPSNQVIGTTYLEGLNYEHSTGAWDWLTNIDWSIAEFTGKVSTFSIDDRTQEDFFNFKFDGYFYVQTAGTYQFRTNSDDGSMMFLGGFNPVLVTPGTANTPPVYDLTQFRIVNNDGKHGTQNANSPEIFLNAGHHRIVVIFFEYTGGQSLTVSYRRQNANGSWPGYTTIPASLLKSGTYTPPTPPSAPTNLSATANGMTEINLAWQYGGSSEHEFEIYRSTSSNGTYTIVNRVDALSFTDTDLTPGTTYYYKLKTVSTNGTTSTAFSNTANATTGSDSEAPTAPTNLAFLNKTYTNVAFNWSASTDNIEVTGYQILINGIIADSVDLPGYMATGLSPATTYSFTVKAFDASGNLSAASAALEATTNAPAQYYSAASGNLNSPATWGVNPDGSGTNPPNFSTNGQVYVLANRSTTGLGGQLTIGGNASRLVVPDGVTLNVDNPIAGKIEVQGSAVVNLNHTTMPEFTSISPSATINFNGVNTIPAGTYGNLSLSGSGNKNFPTGEVVVMGNLTSASGIALKGAPGNASRVTVYGDLTLNGTPGVVASDNAIQFDFVNEGTQTLSLGGNLDTYQITTGASTTLNVTNTSEPVTINVGSLNGGGLALSNGSVLNLGANTLTLKGAAAINAQGQTGQIAIDGGTLNVTSTSNENSNLYCHPSQRTATHIGMNMTGSGALHVQSAVNISESLKIQAGALNSNGNVTLLSNPTQTAYIDEIEGNGVINGIVNVQRWIGSIGTKYRYLSSPVNGQTVANWQQFIPVTGSFPESSPQTTAASMYYYNEPAGGWQPYPPAGTSNQEPLQRGVGYSIYLWNGNSNITMTTSGNPYQGNVPFTLTPQSGENVGWNLLGNPYASPIQWSNDPEAWIKSGVNPTVYVRDNSVGGGQFLFYDAETGNGNLPGGRIAPGQSFWVQTVSANPSLTITERAKDQSEADLYREAAPTNSLAIHLDQGTKSDPTYIVLGEHYNDSYVAKSDARKQLNAIYNLSTFTSDSIDLAVNKISNKFCEKTVPLNIQYANPGEYTLNFNNIESLFDIRELTLKDNFTNTVIDLRQQSSYTFNVTGDAGSTGASRFSVTFKRVEAVANFIAKANDICGEKEAIIKLTQTQPGAKYFVSLNEAVVSDSVLSNGQDIELKIPVSQLQEGNNILKINTGVIGCGTEMLTKEITLKNTTTPVATASESSLSICQGTELTLGASGAPEGGTYKWYDIDGNVLHHGSEQTFTTPTIRQSTVFQVTAVHPNGCEGERTNIFVEANSVPEPIVGMEDSVLHITSSVADDIFRQWYKDGEALSVYESSLKPEEAGVYTVLLSSNGCSKISEPYYFGTSVTNVDPEQNGGVSVYAYPNPAMNADLYIRLESRSPLTAYVTLTDMAGRNFFSSELEGGKASAIYKVKPTDDMAPGVYLVTVVQGDTLVKRKVVILR